MTQIKIQSVVEYLATDMRKALKASVEEVLPNSDIDEYELFRAFNRAVSRKFSSWPTIPDQYVQN